MGLSPGSGARSGRGRKPRGWAGTEPGALAAGGDWELPGIENRTLFTGDNLEIMRGLPSGLVDLVYLDPPYNSDHDYAAPLGSRAAGTAFRDTWTLQDVDVAWWGEIADHNPALYKVIDAAKYSADRSAMSYLIYMAVRILEMHRILKPTGTLCLHCDSAMSHYLKVALDAVFGADRYRNEIVWRRTRVRGAGSKKLRRVHDTILVYAKSAKSSFNRIKMPHDESYLKRNYRHSDKYGRYHSMSLLAAGSRAGNSGKPWRGIRPKAGTHWSCPGNFPGHIPKPDGWAAMTTQQKLDCLDKAGLILWTKKRDGMPRYKLYLKKGGMYMTDMITDVNSLSAHSREYLGYPTQKPLALLERLIGAYSNEGDLVLDPFCGCATACSAAERLGRRWMGIDLSPKAFELLSERLEREAWLGRQAGGPGPPIHRTDIPARRRRDPLALKHRLFGVQEAKCRLCEHEIEFARMRMDHVRPVWRYPNSRLQLLCERCNVVKVAA